MEKSAENLICKRLIHVVCLPFTITTTSDKTPVHLDTVTKAIIASGSPWTRGSSSGLADGSIWDDLQRYQARAYFHPFVRRFLYDKDRVRRFHRIDVQRINVKLDSLSTGPFTIEVDVLRCELVLFQPDVGILLLEVSAQEPLSLQRTQLLLDTFRRLYPPYVDVFCTDNHPTWTAGHCPIEVTLLDSRGTKLGEPGIYRGDTHDFMAPYKDALLDDENGKRPRYPWAGHWRTLLSPLDCTGKAQGELHSQQLGDDRAPILSWIALDDPCAVERGDWMRTCFADAPGRDLLPYAGRFMTEFERKYCYDRYWYAEDESGDRPSRILNCGYAFSFVGCSTDRSFFANENNGAHATFRHIYVEMGLIAHFQKAALLAASQRLSELVKRNGKEIQLPNQQEVREFYDRFVEFTQNFWFDEISPQEQGQELFQMWRKHLHIQELYDEVHQELKDLVAYTEMRATGETNRMLAFVAIAGFLIAFFSLLAGIFGMNKPDEFSWLNWVGLAIAAALMVGVPFTAYHKGIFKRTHPDREET